MHEGGGAAGRGLRGWHLRRRRACAAGGAGGGAGGRGGGAGGAGAGGGGGADDDDDDVAISADALDEVLVAATSRAEKMEWGRDEYNA